MTSMLQDFHIYFHHCQIIQIIIAIIITNNQYQYIITYHHQNFHGHYGTKFFGDHHGNENWKNHHQLGVVEWGPTCPTGSLAHGQDHRRRRRRRKTWDTRRDSRPPGRSEGCWGLGEWLEKVPSFPTKRTSWDELPQKKPDSDPLDPICVAFFTSELLLIFLGPRVVSLGLVATFCCFHLASKLRSRLCTSNGSIMKRQEFSWLPSNHFIVVMDIPK